MEQVPAEKKHRIGLVNIGRKQASDKKIPKVNALLNIFVGN